MCSFSHEESGGEYQSSVLSPSASPVCTTPSLSIWILPHDYVSSTQCLLLKSARANLFSSFLLANKRPTAHVCDIILLIWNDTPHVYHLFAFIFILFALVLCVCVCVCLCLYLFVCMHVFCVCVCVCVCSNCSDLWGLGSGHTIEQWDSTGMYGYPDHSRWIYSDTLKHNKPTAHLRYHCRLDHMAPSVFIELIERLSVVY